MNDPIKIDLGEVFETWTYKGVPIPDVREWTRQRGERLVRYRRLQTYYDPLTAHEIEQTSHGLMPESFFNNLSMIESEHFIAEGMEDP